MKSLPVAELIAQVSAAGNPPATEWLPADAELKSEPQEKPAAFVHPDPTFPADNWASNSSIEFEQVHGNYVDRVKQLVTWFESKKITMLHEAVTALLEQWGHPAPTAWQTFMEPAALDPETSEQDAIQLVRGALHIKFLTVTTEDITNCLMAINAPEVGHFWLAVLERHVVPVMVRLKI